MADVNSQLYTCLSCSIAFLSPEDQREHYKSDHHRYNMKRRVASLPPISAAVFNEKVLERRKETAIMSSTKGSTCHTCNKVYTTENAYRSHIQSKKHKENELKAALAPKDKEEAEAKPAEVEVSAAPVESPSPKTEAPQPQSLNVDEDASEDQVMKTIDEKIAAARSRLSPLHCLFCPHTSPSLDENLTHMSTTHSFFVPDADYLVDIQGLINYLGEKIAVGNVCIFCNERGREFRTMDAVRKHMADKSHCKIAYDTEKDRLEISDFYDFTSSYGNLPSRRKKKKSTVLPAEDEQWEDTDDEDGASADEIVDESPSEGEDDSEPEEDLDDQLTYGDTPYELVLPSGARIGHRSLRRYYAQSFRPVGPVQEEDPNTGAALVRRLIADKNSALVPRKGGFGAFGSGTDVAKARNVGEAREAGRHVREFRDQRRREEYKTKVAFKHNNQKHFRDPLLQ